MSLVHFGSSGPAITIMATGCGFAAEVAPIARPRTAWGKRRGTSLSAIDTFDSESVRNRLQVYLRRQTGGDVEIGPLKRYTVGFSWLTFGFTATWSEGGARVQRNLILRLGPPSGIFAPYQATPEFLTLQSLAGSGVPVPRVFWCCDDTTVLCAPFFVCEFVKGDAPVPWTADGGPAFDEAQRVNLGDQF